MIFAEYKDSNMMMVDDRRQRLRRDRDRTLRAAFWVSLVGLVLTALVLAGMAFVKIKSAAVEAVAGRGMTSSLPR